MRPQDILTAVVAISLILVVSSQFFNEIGRVERQTELDSLRLEELSY